MSARPTFLMAGGGTGGHLFPLVAVADALRAEADVDAVFVGTARGIEARVLPPRGERLELLDVQPIKGGGVLGALRGVVKAALVLPRSIALVRRLAPRAVLSVGGYAAGPVALAARMLGVPVAILEPNGVLGMTNRWLLPFSKRAYVAFPEVVREAGAIAQLTGVPIRGDFKPTPYAARAERFRVLVLGGSQGAQALNERVPDAAARLVADVAGLELVHQAGRGKDEAVRERYAALGISARARVVAFLDDPAAEIAAADVVVERAGASSLAELCAMGRASVLVPFPFAADDHQRRNAESLASTGAAACVVQADATSERLAAELRRLALDVGARVAMAEAARERGRADAARVVALDLLSLGGWPRAATLAARHEESAPREPRGLERVARAEEAVHV